MKSLREYLWFKSKNRVEFLNITSEVQKVIDKSGIKEGLCLVNAMHIIASVFINDDEIGLHHDFKKWLEKLAPHEPISQYAHNGFEDIIFRGRPLLEILEACLKEFPGIKPSASIRQNYNEIAGLVQIN